MKKIFVCLINNKKRAVVLAIIWTALIFFATLLPSSNVPNVQIPFLDKVVHIAIFAGFSFLWAATISKLNKQYYFLILLFTLLTGWLIELLQQSNITNGRSFEIEDIVADTLGGLLGLFIFFFLKKISTSKVS